MSKAFTKEDSDPGDVIVPRRPPLPAGVPNYVTPRGLRLLRAELAALEAERSKIQAAAGTAGTDQHRLAMLMARQNELKERIGSAQVVEFKASAGDGAPDVVRFGARVTVRGPGGSARSYTIVGVDEANAADGRLAFTSPVARALLGRAVGEVATFPSAGAEDEVEIVELAGDQKP